MRELTTIPAASFLTAEEAAAMVEAATLTGADRYGIHRSDQGVQVFDRESGEYLADADGRTVFTERDAHDLRQEYIYS